MEKINDVAVKCIGDFTYVISLRRESEMEDCISLHCDKAIRNVLSSDDPFDTYMIGIILDNVTSAHEGYESNGKFQVPRTSIAPWYNGMTLDVSWDMKYLGEFTDADVKTVNDSRNTIIAVIRDNIYNSKD